MFDKFYVRDSSPLAGTIIDVDAITRLMNVSKRKKKQIPVLLITIFLESTPKSLEKIRLSLQSQDYSTASLVVHTLKSSCANIGAVRMREACIQLETSILQDHGRSSLLSLFTQLKTEYGFASEQLECLLASPLLSIDEETA